MPSNQLPRPPYDEDISSLLPPMPTDLFPISKSGIPKIRQFFVDMTAAATRALLSDPDLVYTSRTIPGPDGNDLTLAIFSLAHHKSPPAATPKPCILHIHGGGLTAGDRFAGIDMAVPWIKTLDAVLVSVEYRRPPEHAFPAPVEDCYAALKWIGDNAAELGIDARRILIEGQSAGGGLAAATALVARDRGGPALLCGQVVGVAMLDDRNDSVSARQFAVGDGSGNWTGEANAFTWECLLGEGEAGGPDVSYYAAPARAVDLSGLPPAYVDVSSTEPFRDEGVAYASGLWRDGVQAELHVWPGGPHGFDVIVPEAAIAKMSVQTRTAWVCRMLREKV
ncbi:Carboxylesterase NlhH [Lasiodiplodia hormozganensis]|uniref:Carboxylesterase NlhH n=1 Tax=Lasiodiplodia hormozganensis TaxID=869390 RepID=A0AA39XR72_9PEZI|nr:Carboxylesterase NlhH [Lasiodiplodia hormozganensis]